MQKVQHLLGTYNLGNMMAEIEGIECRNECAKIHCGFIVT
jgi:hypothetical protein